MERLLVRLPNWLGDLLMSRPLLHALRNAHPGCAIAGVGPAALLELIAADRVIDHAIPWPAGGPERRAALREIRSFAPEAALVLPPSFSSALLAWRSGARERIGFGGEARSALLTRALERPPRGETHLSREYLALGEPLGARPAPVPALEPPPLAAARAEQSLERAGVRGGKLALLGPGARYGPAKRWDPERFAAVARALIGRDFRVLVCGAMDERDECEAVARAAGEGATSLAGTTDLATQAALCGRAALALCNDSGLAHLAAAIGTPTVTIFGSTSSAWTAPLGPRVRVIQRAPVCSPCFRRTCRIGYRCLTAVEVAPVLRACLEVAA